MIIQTFKRVIAPLTSLTTRIAGVMARGSTNVVSTSITFPTDLFVTSMIHDGINILIN